MPAVKKKEADEKAKKEQLDHIQKAVDRMKRPEQPLIKLYNGKEVRIDNGMLDRLCTGARLYVADWVILVDLLISRAIHNVTLLVGTCPSKLPDLKPEQSCLWIKPRATSASRNICTWSILSFQGSAAEVKIYTTREAYGAIHEDLSDVGTMLKMERHKFLPAFYQVSYLPH